MCIGNSILYNINSEKKEKEINKHPAPWAYMSTLKKKCSYNTQLNFNIS